jgi:uncharacterized protein (DUF58 family)
VTTRALHWGPSAQGRALLAVSAVGVAVALVLRDPAVLALVVPALWALLTTARTAEPPTVSVLPERPDLRAREGEPLTVVLGVEVPLPALHLAARVALPSTIEGELGGAVGGARRLELEADVVPQRWGRRRLGPVRVELLSTGGLRSATADVPVDLHLVVLPGPTRIAAASAPSALPDRLGEHVTRAPGQGVEPLSIRPFAPGDPIRRVNWRVSNRRQQLHVNVAAGERAVELVLVVDGLSDVGESPSTSLDTAVRAAAGMAERWLRERDRVGLLVVGGGLRWLTPSHSRHQLERVCEAVLWAARPPGQVPPDLTRVPRSVLPPGAVVVLFSPLLEEHALRAVEALRQRSSRVLVVDVLGDAAPEVDRRDQVGQVAVRLWRLEREATIAQLRRSGSPVLAPDDGPLDRLVALALRTTR